MRYPSGKSIGFAVLIWGLNLMFAAFIVYALFFPMEMKVFIIIGCVLGMSLMLWVWFAAFYEFKDVYLLARMGPFFEHILYERITAAQRFKGMPSSMALSSNMLELRHGKNYITGTTYISPKDQEGFLAELKTHCPNLIGKDKGGDR